MSLSLPNDLCREFIIINRLTSVFNNNNLTEVPYNWIERGRSLRILTTLTDCVEIKWNGDLGRSIIS